jgi:hypothetical protein
MFSSSTQIMHLWAWSQELYLLGGGAANLLAFFVRLCYVLDSTMHPVIQQWLTDLGRGDEIHDQDIASWSQNVLHTVLLEQRTGAHHRNIITNLRHIPAQIVSALCTEIMVNEAPIFQVDYQLKAVVLMYMYQFISKLNQKTDMKIPQTKMIMWKWIQKFYQQMFPQIAGHDDQDEHFIHAQFCRAYQRCVLSFSFV